MNPPPVNPFSDSARPVPTSIPSHLSERVFRTYEPHLTRGVARFPDETEYPRDLFLNLEGRPISPNTFVAGFRNAITSVLRFAWEPNTVDMQKLWSIAGQYQVAMDASGSVWFRARLQQLRPTQYVREARAAGLLADAVTALPVWQDWTIEQVRALVLLVSAGRLAGPYILAGIVDPTLSQELELQYNVAFTYDPEKQQTIVT